MYTLTMEQRVRVISALCEGMSLRATARLTGVNRETVGRLALQVGNGCRAINDSLMRGLNVGVIELDEIWSFIGCKAKRRKESHPDYFGDCYLSTALCARSKAILSYAIGKRDGATAIAFVQDLRERVINRPQITSDGHAPYLEAVERAFGSGCDYAMLIKEFEGEPGPDAARRYSPGRIRGIIKRPISGKPNEALISTSFVERNNLSVRMQVRRFTRLTNAFSKNLEAHAAAIHMFIAWYNTCWVVSTHRLTPAMALGVTDTIWSVEDLVRVALQIDEARAA